MMTRRITAVVVVLMALVGVEGCSWDDDPVTTSPEPYSTETSTSSPPSPSEPAPTESAWEDKYTAEQLDAYEAALTRFETYESRIEPIWSAGKVTPRAEALFKQYFPSPLWERYYSQLRAYEEAGITLEGRARVLSSKPRSISKEALSVVIQQCVDYTAITGSQNGEPIERDAWAEVPRLQTISLSKPEGYDWLVYELEDSTSQKRPSRCTP